MQQQQFIDLQDQLNMFRVIFCPSSGAQDSLALLKMGKICPKHVELILEINKTVIVASRWFLYYLMMMHGKTQIKFNSSKFSIMFMHQNYPYEI